MQDTHVEWNWNHSFIQPWSLTACPWKWMVRCQAMVPPEELAAVWVHKAPVVLLLGNLDRRFPAAMVRMMNLTLKMERYWIKTLGLLDFGKDVLNVKQPLIKFVYFYGVERPIHRDLAAWLDCPLRPWQFRMKWVIEWLEVQIICHFVITLMMQTKRSAGWLVLSLGTWRLLQSDTYGLKWFKGVRRTVYQKYVIYIYMSL